jgi:signal transduction histidine kinase
MKNTSGLRQEVIEEMETLPEEQLRDVLRFIESLRQAPQSSRSIEEKIQAIVDEAPDDIWKNVPADGAEQHDHYIYGAPKKKS